MAERDEFEIARKRAKQQAQANLQQRQQALKRRFAILGTGASGAALKAEERAQTAFGQELEGAEETIGAAERAEKRRIREIQEGRAFQTSERLGSQSFAGEQAALQREFARGERVAGQEFARGERVASQDFASVQAELQRKFATGERISAQEFASAERSSQNAFAEKMQEAQNLFAAGEADKARAAAKEALDAQLSLDTLKFEEAKKQFADNFAETVRINDKNIEFSERMLAIQEQGGFLDSILGGDNNLLGRILPFLGGGAAGGALAELKARGVGGGFSLDPSEIIKKWGVSF